MAKKILVIDDEELVTKSLNHLLKKKGYSVFIASNYQEAMKGIKENDFDLIVSDISYELHWELGEINSN